METEKSLTLEQKIKEIVPYVKRSRAPTAQTVLEYVSKNLRQLSGSDRNISGDGIRKMLQRDDFPEDITTAINKLYENTVAQRHTLEVELGAPEGSYDIETARSAVKKLFVLYGSYSEIGRFVEQITSGAIKSSTIASLNKSEKKHCSKELGDALKRLEDVSFLQEGLAHEDIFIGAIMKTRNCYVREIEDYAARLSNGEAVYIRTEVETFKEALDTLTYSLRFTRDHAVQMISRAFNQPAAQRMMAALKGRGRYVPKKAEVMARAINKPYRYDPKYHYPPNTAVMMPENKLAIVAGEDDGFLKIVYAEFARRVKHNGTKELDDSMLTQLPAQPKRKGMQRKHPKSQK